MDFRILQTLMLFNVGIEKGQHKFGFYSPETEEQHVFPNA